MLIDEEHLDRMREKAKEMGIKIKHGAPDEDFMNNMVVKADQVQNLQVHIQVGDHEIQVDEPVPNGDGSAPSPVELLLASVAGCTEITWIMFCSLLKLAVDKVEVEAEGSIDRRYLMQIPGIPARLKSVRIISRVYTNEPEIKVQKVYETLQKYCPVAGSLHPDIEKEYVLEILPTGE